MEAATLQPPPVLMSNDSNPPATLQPPPEENNNDSLDQRKSDIIHQLMIKTHQQYWLSSAASQPHNSTSSSVAVTSTSSTCVQQGSTSMNNAGSVGSTSNAGVAQQQLQPQHDYMGLALKQWSVYLGNVLLNFIHKECKNNKNSVNPCSVDNQQLNNIMNVVAANKNRTSNNSQFCLQQQQHHQYCASCHYNCQFVNQQNYISNYANFFQHHQNGHFHYNHVRTSLISIAKLLFISYLFLDRLLKSIKKQHQENT